MPVTTRNDYICDRCGAKAEDAPSLPSGWLMLSSMGDMTTVRASGIFCDGCSVGINDATKALPPPEPEPPAP